MFSSYNNLKKSLEKFEANSSEQSELDKIDEVFQKIVIDNQSDLIKSLDLIEDFLLKTLNDQKSFKKSA
jgi:hypothetical protein